MIAMPSLNRRLALCVAGLSITLAIALERIAVAEQKPTERLASDAHSVQSVANALSVRDGYSIHAVAVEPLIVDPVSARLDLRGRLWVVEMPSQRIPRSAAASRSQAASRSSPQAMTLHTKLS